MVKLKFPPKINLLTLKKIVLVLALVVASFSGGYLFGYQRLKIDRRGFPKVILDRELPTSRQTLDFTLFWRVWDILQENYLDKNKLIDSEMVYGAIKGMVAALGDPYTVFLSPQENKIVQEDLQGNFEGVGIRLGFKGTQLAVIAPLPETPAAKAGVKAGDIIIGIEDKNKGIDVGTSGITLAEAVQIIRGPAGSVVTLNLLREGSEDPIVVDITRASIDVPSVILTFVGSQKDIAHIELLKFVEVTNGEWEEVVELILEKSQLQGIVLDLRNNPGGFLEGSVDIAAEFVDLGSTIVIQEDAKGNQQPFHTSRLGKLVSVPVVILINGGSASASEILAGALRDLRGVSLVGQTTFGKGTIQEPIQLNGGAGLHITIAKWLTPKGSWVNDHGLEPDTEISDDPETAEDEQLLRAIEVLSQ